MPWREVRPDQDEMAIRLEAASDQPATGLDPETGGAEAVSGPAGRDRL